MKWWQACVMFVFLIRWMQGLQQSKYSRSRSCHDSSIESVLTKVKCLEILPLPALSITRIPILDPYIHTPTGTSVNITRRLTCKPYHLPSLQLLKFDIEDSPQIPLAPLHLPRCLQFRKLPPTSKKQTKKPSLPCLPCKEHRFLSHRDSLS